MNREKKKQEKEFNVQKNYTHIKTTKLMSRISGELRKGQIKFNTYCFGANEIIQFKNSETDL